MILEMINKKLQIIGKLSGNKRVYINPINARTARLTSDASYVEHKMDKNGKISSVTFEDKYTISIGDIIHAYVNDIAIPYTIREIKHVSNINNMYVLNTHKRTLSSYFILPVLGKCREFFFWDSYFVNSYLHKSDSKREKLKFIYLLYRFSTTDAFVELEKALRSHPMYISSYNPDRSHIMFVFRIPDAMQKHCVTFLRGKYSEFTPQYKRCVIQFHHFEKDGRMYQVLYKDEKLRKQLELEYATTIPKDLDLFDRAEWKDEIYTNKLKDA